MIYLQLFFCFAKIGFTSFGGLSMIPIISSEMTSHKWMTTAEVSDIVAIAEMTPGPLGLNCATFAGMRTAGILGMIVANLGVLLPTFTICVFAAICFERVKNSNFMHHVMTGVRPASIGLIAGIIVSMSMTNYVDGGMISPAAIIIGILDLFLLLRYKTSILIIILLSAALGIIQSFI